MLVVMGWVFQETVALGHDFLGEMCTRRSIMIEWGEIRKVPGKREQCKSRRCWRSGFTKSRCGKYREHYTHHLWLCSFFLI